MKYDIFISYRRDGGFETASLIAEKLRNAGYSVFFDVESLRAGKFNEQLFRVIEQCKDFIIVLPKDGLDRCVNETDWVRQEVIHAMKHGKNIIPVMLRDFEWSENMPAALEGLQYYNSIVAGDHNYFDAAMEKLKFFLKSKRGFAGQKYKTYIIGIIVLLSIIAGIYGWHYYQGQQAFKQHCIEQTNLMSMGIASINQNLNTAQSAYDEWLRFRQRLLAAKPKNAEIIKEEFIQWIEMKKKSVLPPNPECKISDETAKVLIEHGIKASEIKALYSMALPRDEDDVLNYLNYLQTCAKETFITDINDKFAHDNYQYLEYAGKSTYYYFLGLLTTMPNEVYTDFFKMQQNLNHFSEIPLNLSFDEYESKGNAMLQQAEVVVKGMEIKVNSADGDVQKIQQQLNQIEEKIDDSKKKKDKDAEKEVIALLQNIQSDVIEKRQQLQEEKRQQLQEMEVKIEESMRNIIEKCKLSSEDDQYLMWGKIVRIATSMARTSSRRQDSERLNKQDKASAQAKGYDVSDWFEVKYTLSTDEMLQEINSRLDQYAKYFPETKSYVPTVKQFYADVKDGKQTLCGLLVMATKDDMPHPIFKIGDIVLSRKGKTVNNTADYKSVAKTEGDDSVSFLRLSNGKLQKLTEVVPQTEVLAGFLVLKEE